MPDYSKSKIYRIVCNETGETYYGSTTQTLAKRLVGHRADVKKKNFSSKQIIERGNYDMILCEECPCENKEQLHAIERKWIETNECVNKNIPCRTRKEINDAHKDDRKQFYEKNKEEKLRNAKIYYEANKEAIREKARIRYQLNKKTK
jgi:predicted GIY-YIG superfamily endonuclease